MSKKRNTDTRNLVARNGVWHVVYTINGKQRWRSTGVPESRPSEARRIRDEWLRTERLKQAGVVDDEAERLRVAEAQPINEVIAEYLSWCEGARQNAKAVALKADHLQRFASETRVPTLAALTPEVLESNLADFKVRKRNPRGSGLPAWREEPPSATTRNKRRAIVLAFVGWAEKRGRLRPRQWKVVGKVSEDEDRRHVRRAFTTEEVRALFRVARQADDKARAFIDDGRRGNFRDPVSVAFYSAALYAGLRRGDLARLTWADLDFDGEAITVRGGKAKRIDVLPLHPALARELQAIKPTMATPAALGAARVFPRPLTVRTVQKDLLRAGLAREVPVLNVDGDPVTITNRQGTRTRTRIDASDERGNTLDLHCLRATLATWLAQAGVSSVKAARLMRHADPRTTQRHYTHLELADDALALSALPTIDPDAPDSNAHRATGTDPDATSIHTGANGSPRQPLARTGTDGHASRSEASAGATGQMGGSTGVSGDSGTSRHTQTSKRVTGVEPATFSLGS